MDKEKQLGERFFISEQIGILYLYLYFIFYVNISESCDFWSQFDPLYIIL